MLGLKGVHETVGLNRYCTKNSSVRHRYAGRKFGHRLDEEDGMHTAVVSVADMRQAFRRLYEAGCFVIPNPWDIGSAHMMQAPRPTARVRAGWGHAKASFGYFFWCRQEKSTERFRQVLVLPTEFGRRDWTRTNDPHHVKVVL
jgi:hypothetical protein